MPPIKSVTPIADGFRIVKRDGSTIELTSSDIPEAIKASGSPAECESWINTVFLPSRLTFLDEDSTTQWEFYAAAEVSGINPLNVEVIVSDYPIAG